MLTSFAAGRVFGHRHGAGPPRVLALHGWQRDSGDWAAVLDRLDAIALDLPGFGATPPPPEVWGSARYAQELGPVLDEMASPVVVAGHSFGGRVAVHLAQQRPAQVAGLVLTGTPGLWPVPGGPSRRPAPRYRLGRWLHRRGLLSDARMEDLRQRYGSADYRAAQGVLRDILVAVVNERYDDVLRSLTCPVRLVWGDDDPAAPVAAPRLAAAALEHVALTEVPGAGHFTLATATAGVRAAIEELL